MNRVTLIGKLVYDPALVFSVDSTYTQLTLVTNDHQSVNRHKVILTGDSAEFARDVLSADMYVHLEGSLVNILWVDDYTGEECEDTTVVLVTDLNNIHLLRSLETNNAWQDCTSPLCPTPDGCSR